MIESAAPQLSQADVERHRRDHYAGIVGMAPIIGLPTDFSRNEVYTRWPPARTSRREAARSLLEKSGASAEQKEALQCFLDDPNNFGGY